jgi:hypothetical protein
MAFDRDLQTFQQLVTQYQAEVYGRALQLTGHHAEALDVAQEVFVQLHAAMARMTSHAHVKHWLLRAVGQRTTGRQAPSADEYAAQAAPADPGPDFTARVMARVQLRWSHRRADFTGAVRRNSRGRHRGAWIAALATIGIGAICTLWISQALHKPDAAPLRTTERVAAGPAPAAATAAQTQQDPGTAAPRAAGPAASRDPYPRYTLIVLPLRQASLDPASLAPAEAFHAALVAEMRKMPGLALLLPGVTAPPESAQSADFLLTVTTLEARALPGGTTAFRVADSRGGAALSAASNASGRQWPVEIRIQPIGQSTSAGFTSTLQIGDDTASLPMLAARQMELLRVRIFPDVQMKQQLIARIRDASLPATERNTALDDLLGAQRERGRALDAVDIGVIVAGAAAMPAEERARLWRSLRGAPHAELVDTLVDSMRRDPDIQVRFEALATLAADYAAEARVRSAIEAASREDPAQLMRMAAQRVRNGEAEWRRYMVSTLKDASLPLLDRLAPLLLAAQSATTPVETLGMRTLTADEEIVKLLEAMVRGSWFDYTQTESIGAALELLAGGASPAASSLLVEIQQESAPPAGQVASATPMTPPQISPAAMSWLMKNRNNPRARRILDDLARGRADPQAAFMIEQMMQQRPPPRRP